MCKNCMQCEFAQLKKIIDETGHTESALITILHKTQDYYGYIPKEAQAYIAEELNIPASKVYGVLTFYSYFMDKPKGKYQISVCLGTACYVKGATEVLKSLEDELGIKYGETTRDLKFSIAQTRCLGDCSNAPVVMINDKLYGKVQPTEIATILAEYKKE